MEIEKKNVKKTNKSGRFPVGEKTKIVGVKEKVFRNKEGVKTDEICPSEKKKK